jgi:hypothetical protein
VSTTSFIEGCSENIGGDNYMLTGTAGAFGANGTITITVTAEATKTISTLTIPVTVIP